MKKRIYSILSLLLVFMLTFACFTGCKDKDEDTSSPNSSVEEVVTLSFSQKTVSLSIGESFQTTLTGLVEGETVQEYSSNRSSVATVDNAGKISALAVGDAVIKATTNQGNSALIAVTVYDKTLMGTPVIEVAKDNVRLQVGDAYALDARLVRGEEVLTGNIAWHTDNATVVTVENGEIRALSEGSALLTAKATYDGIETMTTVTVTVYPKDFTACPDYENKTVYKGNTFPLTVSANNGTEEVELSVSYTSSNLDIAYLSTVDGVTTLEALKGGNVTITATFAYDGVEYTMTSEMYIYGTHTVSVYALGYTNVSRDHRITGKMYGDIVTLSLDKKVDGRDIKCWYVNGEKIEGNRFVMPDTDVIAYAKYVNETEGDFTTSFTESAMFGLNQANVTFRKGVLQDENEATNTDNNYVEIGAVGKDGGAITFNFDESVFVSDIASVVLRVYCPSSTSIYLGVGATKKALFGKNAVGSNEVINKKANIETDCWVEITVPLNDFTANDNVLSNFSIGVIGGVFYVDYIMLKY